MVAPQAIPSQDARAEGAVEAAVGAPPDDCVWLQLSSPARDLPILADAGMGRGEAIGFFLAAPVQALGITLGEGIAGSVDLHQPVDVLLNVDEEDLVPTYAFDLLASADPAALGGLTRSPIDGARWRLQRSAEETPAVDLHCELWERVAPARPRILCGKNAERLEAHGPFLMSALPTTRASLRVELDARRIRAITEKEAGSADAEPESAAGRAGADFGQLWMSSLTLFALEVTVRDGGAEVAVEMRNGEASGDYSMKSWFGGDAPRAVSDTFWQLPSDAQLAVAFNGLDAEPLRKAKAALHDALSQDMREELELSPAELDEMKSMLERVVPPHAAFVVARGRDSERIASLGKSLAALDAAGKPPPPSELDRFDAALAGWFVIGIDVDTKSYIPSLRQALAFNPGKPKPAAAVARPAPPQITLTSVVQPPKALPPGSLCWTETVRRNPAHVAAPGAAGPHDYDVHYVAVPDQGRLWVARARDSKTAVALALQQLDGSRTSVLARDAELVSMGRSSVALAVSSLEEILGWNLEAYPDDTRKRSEAALEELAALPHRGQSRLRLRVDIEPSPQPGEQSLWVRSRWSREALDDLLHLVKLATRDE